MRSVPAFNIALVLFVATAVRADILLDGHNHVGSCDDTTDIDTVAAGVQTECDGFTPLDPVSRDNNFNTPIAFHLTTMTTIDKVRLDNPISLNEFQVYIQPLFGSLDSSEFGMLSGNTYDLIPDLAIGPGYFSILIDGGCRDANGGGSFFYTSCTGSIDDDFGYSSITLISTQASTSRMLIQRRHPGNPAGPFPDNDIDDDYDFADAGAPYYPDIAEGHPLDIPFNIDQNRRLSEIRFFRARDVDDPLSTILIDGFAEYGLPNSGDPLEANPTIISTNQLLLLGNHTLRVQLGVIGPDDVDSFSWDSIILTFTNAAPSGSLGRFNAVDTDQVDAIGGSIGTRIANKGSDLDLYAINPLGTGVNAAYTGTVDVHVLDASDDSGGFDIYGCRTSWGQAVNFLLGSVTFAGGDNGKKKISGVSYPNALKIARVRVTDTVTGASGCSTDAFAIRPKDLRAVASDDDPATPGLTRPLPTGPYDETTAPFHKAGQPFTLVVTPRAEGGGALSGYDGTPTLTAKQVELGTQLGSVNAGSWGPSGTDVRSDGVTYSEVGAVRFTVADETFAAVDAGDSNDAERHLNSHEFKVGRFVPDHFTVAKSEITPGCGTFTYFGQPFGYAAGAVTLTAVDAAGTTTLNYTDTPDQLFKLAPIPQATFAIFDDAGTGTPTLTVPVGTHAVTDNGDGTGTIVVQGIQIDREDSPVTIAMFNAEIGIEFPAFTDDDGVGLLPADSPIIMGTAAAGSGAPFVGGANSIRYGRMYIQPSFGSEHESMNLPLRTEFWDGTTFVPTNAAACTPLVAADITAGNLAVGQTVGLVDNGAPVTDWTIDLSEPGDVREVNLSVDLNAVGPYLFLLDDTDADGKFDNDPSANASFGFYDRSGDNRIFQREVFR